MKPDLVGAFLPQPLIFLLSFGFYTFIHLWLYSHHSHLLLQNSRLYKFFNITILFIQLFVITLTTYELGDIVGLAGAGFHLRHKIDFYFIDQDHGQYPYFPVMIFPQALFSYLSAQTIFTFSFYQKLLLICGLQITGKYIYKIGRSHLKDINAKINQLQFLTNPVICGAILFHGQTDILVLATFVAGYYLYHQKVNFKIIIQSTILIALSIGIKTWSIFFLPSLLRNIKNEWYKLTLGVGVFIFLFLDVFLYTRIVDGSSIKTVMPAVIRAGGPVGNWGISLLFAPWKNELVRYNLLIFGLMYLLCQYFILRKKITIWDYPFLTILGVYIVITNWGVQYLVWILPFLYLSKLPTQTNQKIFIFFSSIYTFVNYFNIIYAKTVIPEIYAQIVGIMLWVFCLYWFVSIIFSSTKPDLKKF